MGRSDSDGSERDGNLNLDGVADVRRFKVDVAQGIYEADPNVPGDAQEMQAFIQFLHQTNPDLLKVRPAAAQVDPEAAAKAIKEAAQKAFEKLPQAGGSTTGKRLAEAIAEWQIAFAETNPNTKTQSTYASVLRRFLDCISDLPVRDITADHIRRYRNHRKEAGIKVVTIDGDTKALGRFFTWAQRDGHYPKTDLPTQGQTELKKKREREKNSNGAGPFSLEELKTIFQAEHYRKKNSKPHEFWLPILALYTGARIEELTQLHITDIFKDRGSKLLVIDINDDDDKKLKTPAAARKIPMHPDLVDLGFLDYWADVKATVPNDKHLFPYLNPTKHGRLSDSASKKFGTYLDTLGISTREKVFHSFRDTLNNALADVDVTLEIRCGLLGQQSDNVNITNYRNKLLPTLTLYDFGLSKLRYERLEADDSFNRLDLSPLKYKKGAFADRLITLMATKEANKEIYARRVATLQARQEHAERQAKRPGRPPKEKPTETINSGEDAKAKAERLQALEARALRNQQRRALKKQLSNQGKPNA